MIDFGNMVSTPMTTIPTSQSARARGWGGDVERGILLCGSGVGAIGSGQQGERRARGALP